MPSTISSAPRSSVEYFASAKSEKYLNAGEGVSPADQRAMPGRQKKPVRKSTQASASTRTLTFVCRGGAFAAQVDASADPFRFFDVLRIMAGLAFSRRETTSHDLYPFHFQTELT